MKVITGSIVCNFSRVHDLDKEIAFSLNDVFIYECKYKINANNL
jgi:hypothetical protein